MIQLTADQIERVERMLENFPDAIPRVTANAINRAAESARTEAARMARQTYYVKNDTVLKTIKIHRASPGDLSAIVLSRSTMISLTKFRVTPKQPEPKRKRPIIARVIRGQGGPIKGAFVARMKSGHLGVFNRTSKKRFPIVERYGPSVPEMLDSPSTRTWVERRAMEQLDKRLDHEIKRVLEADL